MQGSVIWRPDYNFRGGVMQGSTRNDDGAKVPVRGEASALLRAWSEGDQDALEKLIPIVYDELHRLARR